MVPCCRGQRIDSRYALCQATVAPKVCRRLSHATFTCRKRRGQTHKSSRRSVFWKHVEANAYHTTGMRTLPDHERRIPENPRASKALSEGRKLLTFSPEQYSLRRFLLLQPWNVCMCIYIWQYVHMQFKRYPPCGTGNANMEALVLAVSGHGLSKQLEQPLKFGGPTQASS